MTVFTKKIVK